MTTPRLWSVWGLRLVAILSVASAVSLIWMWIQAFYRSVAVNTLLSFTSADKPYTPPPSTAKPVMGNHFFGDYQTPLGYASDLRHSISPYLGTILHPNYPPFSQALFLPFTFLPLRTGALIYLLLSAAVFLLPLWLMMRPIRWEYRILILTLVAVLTTPFITFLDRGNDIGLVTGLVAWGLWAWRTERWKLCGGFLAAAIALKAYPAAVLVVPLGLRRYRFTLLVAASAVVVNFIAVLFFPGGPIQNLRGFLTALKGIYAPMIQLFSWSLYSLVPKTAGLMFGRTAITPLLAPGGIYTWVPSVLFLLGVYFVIRRGRVPQWCWGPLGLASIQLFDPVSFVYTTGWAPAAALWYASGHFVEIRDRDRGQDGPTEWMTLRIMVLGALIVTLAPSVFTVTGSGGFTTQLTEYLSPLFLAVTLCTAVIQSLSPVTPRVRSISDDEGAASPQVRESTATV